MGVIRFILQLRKLRLTGEVACLKSHSNRVGEIGLEPQSVQLQILCTIHRIFKSLPMYQLVTLSAAANNTSNKMGVYFRCFQVGRLHNDVMDTGSFNVAAPSSLIGCLLTCLLPHCHKEAAATPGILPKFKAE